MKQAKGGFKTETTEDDFWGASLNCSTYDEFHQLNKEYKVYEDESSLWNREFLREPIDGCTLVHGHTPTFKAKEYIRRMPKNYMGFPVFQQTLIRVFWKNIAACMEALLKTA